MVLVLPCGIGVDVYRRQAKMATEPEIWGGNIIKLSHGGLKGWKKRYFLLEAGRLFYYDKISNPKQIKPPGNMKPLATNSLYQVLIQFIENADISETNLTLGYHSLSEALEWKEHFQKHVDYANNNPEDIAPSQEVARRIFRSKHSTDSSDSVSISSYGSESTTEGAGRRLSFFQKKKRQSRGVEVDWGDDPGWNSGGGKRPSNANTLSLTPEALSQVQSLAQVNSSDPDISLVTELPVESLCSEEIQPKATTISPQKMISRSESAPDATTTVSPPNEATKKKRSLSFVPSLPTIPVSNEDSSPAATPPPSETPELLVTEPKELETHRPQDPVVNISPEKRKERTSILGKLGLRKSVVQSVQAQEHQQSTPQQRQQQEVTTEDVTTRRRSSSSSSEDQDGRKRRPSLMDRLGLHHSEPQSEPVVEPSPKAAAAPPDLPPRFYFSLRVILPHGVNLYATPSSDSRLLLKLRKLSCGEIIPVHTLRILEHKYWYESDVGWVEGAVREGKGKSIQSRGLLYCSNGIPTKATVLKLHFTEVLKKGWFRTTTTYETEFILEIAFMSPETGIENNLLRLRRGFQSLHQLQSQLSEKYSDLAWHLFEMNLHGFPVLTDGTIGIIEDPDRALQLMDAMGHWFSTVLSRIDVQSCNELNLFLRPNETDCFMMDIDLSPSGGLNGAW